VEAVNLHLACTAAYRSGCYEPWRNFIYTGVTEAHWAEFETGLEKGTHIQHNKALYVFKQADPNWFQT